MKKTIKFDLPIDGVKVSTLDELRDHFTAEIVGHFRSGLLAKWLRSRRLTKQLDAIEALTTSEDSAILQGLCEIFGVEADMGAISAAVAKPTGVSVGDLAGEIQVPAEVLLAYLKPSGSSQKSADRIVSNKERFELLRHLIFQPLRNLRTIALGEKLKGRIAGKGESEVWVFDNPLPVTIVIQTRGELNTGGYLFDSSGNLVAGDEDNGGELLNFKMTARLDSGLYFALVTVQRNSLGFISFSGTETGGYELHVQSTSDDTLAIEPPDEQPEAEELASLHPLLPLLSIQLQALTKLVGDNSTGDTNE